MLQRFKHSIAALLYLHYLKRKNIQERISFFVKFQIKPRQSLGTEFLSHQEKELRIICLLNICRPVNS